MCEQGAVMGKTWTLRATAAARPDAKANMCHWASCRDYARSISERDAKTEAEKSLLHQFFMWAKIYFFLVALRSLR